VLVETLNPAQSISQSVSRLVVVTCIHSIWERRNTGWLFNIEPQGRSGFALSFGPRTPGFASRPCHYSTG